MTVFVVFECAYDDSCIHGIFSSKEKAEEYVIQPDRDKCVYYPGTNFVITEWEVQ